VPEEAVKVWPVLAVPLTTGSTVLAGTTIEAAIAAEADELAITESAELVAVT
jgi:hypothetical protein